MAKKKQPKAPPRQRKQRLPQVEARQRETEDLYDFHLMASNPARDHLLGEWQGRPPGNVKRDFARIKKAMASAELVIVKRTPAAPADVILPGVAQE